MNTASIGILTAAPRWDQTPTRLSGILFLLFFLVIAMRWAHPTPRCVNDEVRYTEIIGVRTNASALPISGPGYVWLVSNVSTVANVPLPRAVAWVGLIGAALLLGTLGWVLHRTVPQLALPAMLAVACTSYFWAGISESRPQLFGCSALVMALFLLSEVVCDETVRVRVALSLLVLSALIAIFHILSFFVFCCLCFAALLAVQMRQQAQARAHASRVLMAILAVGNILIFYPQGLYHVMIADIVTAHLINPALILGVCTASLLAGILVLSLTRRFGRNIQEIRFSAFFRQSADRALIGMAALAFVLFSIQAALLPKHYWAVYDHSPLRFAASQWGNLVYAAFFLWGVRICAGLIAAGELGRGMIAFVTATGAMVMVAAMFLVISLGLLHTNWMLRAVDYAVIFGGPIAAYGVMQLWRRNPVGVLFLLSSGALAGLLAGTKSPLFFATC